MENKKLTLDYSKWICGIGGSFPLGEGEVALLNKEGFMCCLGQWSLQLGATTEDIIKLGEPEDVNLTLPGLSYEDDFDEDQMRLRNTKFSLDAMQINDGKETTPTEKLELLADLCAENGFELEVINKPTP